MQEKSLSKIKYLLIWDFLCLETDKNHPKSTEEIREMLKGKGIACDRRTLYRNIEELKEYGYEIKIDRKQSNMYYVDSHDFNNAQIHILLDAVQAASFITENQTKELVNKIAALGGNAEAEEQRINFVNFNTAKSDNDEIYWSVEAITEAIRKKKKITFNYFKRNLNREKEYTKENGKIKLYKVNPEATVYDEEKYYLIGYYDNGGKFQHFRIEKMENVRVTKEDITDQEHTPYGERQNVVEYRRQLISMFSGESMQVSFLIHYTLLDEVYRKLGRDVKIFSTKDDMVTVSATVQDSPTFKAWCCSFGTQLKVVSPQKLVDEIKDYAQKIADQYK